MRAASVGTATRVAAASNGVALRQPFAYNVLAEQILTTASQGAVIFGGAALSTGTATPPGGQTSYLHATGFGYPNGSRLSLAFTGPWDFTGCFFRFRVRCQSYNATQSYYVRFATSKASHDAGNFLEIKVAPGNSAPNWLVPASWVWDSFDPLLMAVVGSSTSLSSISYITFASSDAASGSSPDWDFARIQLVQKAGLKAKCVIWHDDSVASGYTAIKSKLDAYGWAGSEANEWGAIDTGPTFLTSSDLVTAKAAGWHIGSHAFSPAEHVSVTEAQLANQMLRSKTFAAKYGITADSADFAFWGGLAPDIAYRQMQRLCRSGRYYTSQLQQPETQPPGDPHLMKALGADSGQTFATHWKPIIQNAITTTGIAQIVFHQQIGSDSSQAAEFDAMLTWLDQNRASIDVVSFGAAIAPLLTGYVPGVVPAPTAMTLAATAGNAQVVVSRTGGVGTGVTYKLYRGTTATGTPIATSLPFTDTGLTNGTAVSYVATATNTGGTVTSNTITVTPIAPRDPSTVSGMTARYRADSITGLANAASVASWSDGSGNNYTATNATAASQPKWYASGQNSKPYVKFAYSSTTKLTSAAPSGAASQTVFAVVNLPGTGSGTIRGCDGVGGLLVRSDSGKPTNYKQFGSNLGASPTSIPANATSVLITTYDSTTGSKWKINGADAGSSTTVATLETGGTVIGVGGSQYDALTGDIYELVVFNRVLTAAELKYLDQYVQDYYGITVSDYA